MKEVTEIHNRVSWMITEGFTQPEIIAALHGEEASVGQVVSAISKGFSVSRLEAEKRVFAHPSFAEFAYLQNQADINDGLDFEVGL